MERIDKLIENYERDIKKFQNILESDDGTLPIIERMYMKRRISEMWNFISTVQKFKSEYDEEKIKALIMYDKLTLNNY